MTEKSAGRGPSQRQLRVGELLRQSLADIFLRGEIQDPDLENISLSVVEVSVSPDMRNATAYIMPLGQSNHEAILTAVSRHTKFIRGQVSRQVKLKYMPNIAFQLDETLEAADKIDSLLRSPKVAQDLSKQ